MKILQQLMLIVSLSFAASSQAAIMVYEPGDDGFNIETFANNDSPYTIQSLTFDFSATLTGDGGQLIIDGSPLSISGPAGGSATFFGSGSIFGFTFTGFDPGEIFSFKWDPDSTFSGAYGATSLDFLGGIVTALTSGGVLSGEFQLLSSDTLDVTAVLAAEVPEPGSYALLMAALLAIAFSRRIARN